MNRPRRLSGVQCLQLIEQMAADDSGDDAHHSNSDSSSDSELSCAVGRDSSSDSDDDNHECSGRESGVEDQATPEISQEDRRSSTNLADAKRGGSRRGRGRGRGRGVRSTNPSSNANQVLQCAEEKGRDGSVWTETAVGKGNIGRRAQQNVFKNKPGPTPYAARRIKCGSAHSAFSLIIDEPLLRHIQRCTQEEARRQVSDSSWSITIEELESFIAILLARGASGAKGLSLKSLWSADWGLQFCLRTMARNRFTEIMKYLRFDLKSSRSERIQYDKFALASEIWDRFIINSATCYNPDENVTIDEQLFPTKARCRWTQYMANKPDKFGLKFWLAADVNSKYLVNGFPYLGKDDMRPAGQSLSENVVLRLMEPLFGKGHNVTCDNFFTSLKLMKQLRDKKTSLVGTVNRARRELPPSVADTSTERYSTRLLKHEDFTLTIYRCKPSKNVVIMSSLHNFVDIATEQVKKLPETVSFYNSTKYGVDVLDQMCRKYSVKAASRRWPVHVWYNILDLAAINAWILYKSVTGQKISRRNFIVQLAEELRQSGSKQSVSKLSLSPVAPASADSRKRRHCQVARCKGNKSAERCLKCTRTVCGSCIGSRILVCVDCSKK